MKKNIVLFLMLSLSAGLFAAEISISDILRDIQTRPVGFVKNLADYPERLPQSLLHAFSKKQSIYRHHTFTQDGIKMKMMCRFTVESISEIRLTWNNGRPEEVYVEGTPEYIDLCTRFNVLGLANAPSVAGTIDAERRHLAVAQGLHRVQHNFFKRNTVTVRSKELNTNLADLLVAFGAVKIDGPQKRGNSFDGQGGGGGAAKK